MEAKMSYRDFREWLDLLDKRGEVKHLSGASWDLEMSGIAEIVYHEGKSPKPALLFSDIPGYPAHYRTLFGILASIGRISLTLNLLGTEVGPTGLVKEWRAKTKGLSLIPEASQVGAGFSKRTNWRPDRFTQIPFTTLSRDGRWTLHWHRPRSDPERSGYRMA